MNFLRELLNIKSPSEELLDPMNKERERQIKELIRKREGVGMIKISTGVAIVGWSSTFALAWSMITRLIETTAVTWFFFAFFLVVAFISSVARVEKKGS